KWGPALAEARKLAATLRGRFPLTFPTDPRRVGNDHAFRTITVADLLRHDAVLRAHKGDLRGALASSRAALNAARSLADEPFAGSAQIRVHGVTIACQMFTRTLAQGQAADANLAEVQQLLVEEERHPTLLLVLRGERA